MKILKILFSAFLMGSLMISCEKQEIVTDQDNSAQQESLTVPDIPDEIASLMSEEDKLLFRQGPGERFMNGQDLSSARWAEGRWHPVLMALEYHLQFYPVSSCEPDNLLPCFYIGEDGMPAPTGNCPFDDEGNLIAGGVTGITMADGHWFFRPLHSEYYPVFCLPDYSGYGQGFYRLDGDELWIQGENTPFQIDEEGNVLFRRNASYTGGTGCFEGAKGWEIMISYTAAENSPSNSPTGQGYSEVIIFGWVYY